MTCDMERAQDKIHWFLHEEFKWRSIASGVWTWWTAFPILGAFLFGFTLDLSKHIFIIYDFVGVLVSVHTLGICIAMTSLTVLLVWLHTQYYAVSPTFPRNRFELVRKIGKASNMFFLISSMSFAMLIAHFATCLMSEKYSWNNQCNQVAMDNQPRSCEGGFHLVFVLFGLTIGFVDGLDRLLNQKLCLSYFIVQEAKFLFIKCKLPCVLSDCAMKAVKIVYYYLIAYFIIGFVMRDIAVLISGTHASEFYSLQIWKIFGVLPVVWNLWLVGTLSLLLWEVSWQFFNVYHTQGYLFLLHPVLPENEYKLLTKNLDESNPQIVQHLAFQHLSLIAKQNPSKREQIFALSQSTENGQPVSWNKILSNCLDRIKRLTNDVTEFQSTLSEIKEGKGMGTTIAKTSTDKPALDDSNAQLHQRMRFPPVHDITASSFIDHTLSNVSVPTPRLWTTFSENTIVEGKASNPMYTANDSETSKSGMMQKKIQSFAQKAFKLPIVSYFMKTVPPWALRNIYRDHRIVKLAMQSLSHLCAASVDEDRFGVVQGRLRDVVTSFIDLMMALDSLGKVAVSSNSVSKLHLSLCSEAKSSLQRIVETFGESLKSVNLPPEYRSRLFSFCPYED